MLAHRLEELLADAAIRIAVHQSHADCTSDGVANLREGYQQEGEAVEHKRCRLYVPCVMTKYNFAHCLPLRG